jgi:hypothetical protein
MNWVTILTTVCALLGASGVAVRIFERKSRNRAWQQLAESRRSLDESRRRLMEGQIKEPHSSDENEFLDKYWGPSSSSRENSTMLKLVEIERESEQLLDTIIGPGDRQLFEMRARLHRLGIWSDSDVKTFDRAMVVRNGVVHGSAVPSVADSPSSKELDQLLDKLRSASAIWARPRLDQ